MAGTEREPIDALLVPLRGRRRPLVAVTALTMAIFLVGVMSAIGMVVDGATETVALGPGEQRAPSAPSAQARRDIPAVPLGATTTTRPGGVGAPVIGVAGPDPVQPAGRGSRSPTSTTTAGPKVSTSTTTTTASPSPWRATAPAPAGMAGRSGHRALWTGNRMVVLGGTAEGRLTGAAYDPGADRWHGVPDAPFEEGAWQHARLGAVWTGDVVAVAGRTSLEGGVLGAAAYDPSTGTWARWEGVPEGITRVGGIVAWSGAEVVVFGGDEDGGTARTAGAAYDPAAQSWRRLAPAPVALGAADDPHVASVWTGTLLLVWNDSHDGYAYDPAKDAWSALPDAPFAQPLDEGAVTWTGTEALWTFGRDAAGATPAAVGAYDPVGGTWRTIGGVPVPGRRGPAAVRAGASVFACCGDHDDEGAAGAVYDSAAGKWSTLPASTLVPPGRVHATAVWTGAAVVVWGGTGSDARGAIWTP